MNRTTSSLNGNFGIKIDDVTPSDLNDPRSNLGRTNCG